MTDHESPQLHESKGTFVITGLILLTVVVVWVWVYALLLAR